MILIIPEIYSFLIYISMQINQAFFSPSNPFHMLIASLPLGSFALGKTGILHFVLNPKYQH